MFGQNNDQNQQQPDGPIDSNPMLQNSAPPAGFFNPAAPSQAQAPAITSSDNQQPALDASANDQEAPMIMDDNPTSFVAPATPADVQDEAIHTPLDTSAAPDNTDELLSMKQQALQQLTPLVNHLDQTPEEKFRTVMMMIQASDDHSKLGEAFDLAKQITDDKTRAQALLDVINEINYFTQHQN